MQNNDVRKEIYQILDKPDWWFKSNNWKRLHGYPMLHHQKKEKSKAIRRKQVKLFEHMEKVIDEQLIKHANTTFKDFVNVNDLALGDRIIQIPDLIKRNR